jgi:hypothetical protein
MAMGLGKEFFCDLHRLETIFRYFDLDGRGGVSAENIDRCFKRFGRNIGVARINEVIQSGDVDGDNLIQFDEFRDLMCVNRDGSMSGRSLSEMHKAETLPEGHRLAVRWDEIKGEKFTRVVHLQKGQIENLEKDCSSETSDVEERDLMK